MIHIWHKTPLVSYVLGITLALSFLYPTGAEAADLGTLTSVDHDGAILTDGATVYRSDFSNTLGNWTFHFTWPRFVQNNFGIFAVFRGTFGALDGGMVQVRVNADTRLDGFQEGINDRTKQFTLQSLGNRSVASGTYTVLVAETLFPNQEAALMEWFATGGVSGTEPVDYSFITFTYVAEDVPIELPGALTYVDYDGFIIPEGGDVFRENISEPEAHRWTLEFTWPNPVEVYRTEVFVFRGTYGDVVGGPSVLDQNYFRAPDRAHGLDWTFFEGFNRQQHTILPLSFRASTTEPSMITILIFERDPKIFASQVNPQDEADWFASGGAAGHAPKQYATFTFDYKKYHECCSSVVFLPGIKAIELYENDNKVWLPSLFGTNAGRLEMNNIGESINNLTVGGPVGRAYIFLDVYESFSDFLTNLKVNQTINNWKSFSYDWRYDVLNIVENNVQLQDGTILKMLEEIKDVAEASQTGKVTLIAHSNGGLVGKGLISALGNDANTIIDRLVMIGTPQLGAPSAIGALLHAENQGLPLDSLSAAMQRDTARQLSRNMPGAYGLLPLHSYFNDVLDPVVTFDPATNLTLPYRTAYGDSIGGSASNPDREKSDLYSFLLGIGDGRSEPQSNDLTTPIKLNQFLLDNASTSRLTLESWQPPSSLETIQVVGWGKDTVKTINYTEFCNFGLSCKLYPRPIFTLEGDQTVVWPSAADIGAVTTYFFNLKDAGNFDHANLLASPELQTLLEGIVTQNVIVPQFFSTTKPTTQSVGKRLYASVHSPVTIGIHDVSNRFTGITENPDPSSDVPLVITEVPGTFYLEFGEGKYVGFNGDQDYELVMEGIGSGVFTLEIEEKEGDVITATTTYSNVPVSPTTRATLAIQDIQNKGSLEVDSDGNGTIDLIVEPDIEKEPELTPQELLQQFRTKLETMQMPHLLKIRLKADSLLVEYLIKNNRINLAKITVKLMKSLIERRTNSGISPTDAGVLLSILEKVFEKL